MTYTISPADLGVPVAVSLPIILEYQAMGNWCWAAIGAAAANFQTPTHPRSQYEVAATVTNNPLCGGRVPPGFCDTMHDVASALDLLGVAYARKEKALRWDELSAALGSGCPVIARLQWSSGRGHVVMIAGYAEHQQVVVLDSEAGARLVRLASFPNEYRVGGTWTHSYVVKAAAPTP